MVRDLFRESVENFPEAKKRGRSGEKEMKRTGRILTAATVLLGVVITAPIIVKAVKGKKEDEAKKEPVRQAVVLLDAAKTPEQLGVTSVQLNIDGSNCTVRLKDGRVKFAAGCGADKLIANVQGFGSVPLEYEVQTVYTETEKYELYRLKPCDLTPCQIFGNTAKCKIDLYAYVGTRMYKIGSVNGEAAGAIDTIWKVDAESLAENELPPMPIIPKGVRVVW